MVTENNASDSCDVAAGAPASPVEKLTRAQVFARDPEQTTRADLEFVVEELRKINVRNRKARKDDANVAEVTTKMKKANAATRKKKAGPLPADPLDAKL